MDNALTVHSPRAPARWAARHHTSRANDPGDRPSESASSRDGLLTRRHAELAIDAAGVRFDGVERDVQLGADLALRELAGEQAKNRQLGVGERLRRWRAVLAPSWGQPQPALESRE